jgi:hypothetical protein
LHIAADISTLYYATVNERIETVRIHGKAKGIDINVSNEITSASIHSSPRMGSYQTAFLILEFEKRIEMDNS